MKSHLKFYFLTYFFTLGSLERTGNSLGTEGTLLRRLLALATRPSPLAASHTPRELAVAALAIAQQLAAHVSSKYWTFTYREKARIRSWGKTFLRLIQYFL